MLPEADPPGWANGVVVVAWPDFAIRSRNCLDAPNAARRATKTTSASSSLARHPAAGLAPLRFRRDGRAPTAVAAGGRCSASRDLPGALTSTGGGFANHRWANRPAASTCGAFKTAVLDVMWWTRAGSDNTRVRPTICAARGNSVPTKHSTGFVSRLRT